MLYKRPLAWSSWESVAGRLDSLQSHHAIPPSFRTTTCFALSRQMGEISPLNSWTQNWQHSSHIPWARICHVAPLMCGVAGTYSPWPPAWLPSDIWLWVLTSSLALVSPDPQVWGVTQSSRIQRWVLPSSPLLPQQGCPPHFTNTKVSSPFSTPQILLVDSVRTSFNVFPFYSLLSLASSFSLPVLVGTIRIPKVGPKPCNIVRKWLAGRPPRGLPKWHYLNEFFTVHGLARRLTDPKIQSY